MKKLYVVLIAMISVSSIFAQDRGWNNHSDNRYPAENRSADYPRYHANNDYNNQQAPANNRYYGQQQMQERDRRAAIERVNRDYDQRIDRYRNDRSMNRYERDRRIAQARRERQQQVSSFGKGAVVGAIVGVIAGAILSH